MIWVRRKMWWAIGAGILLLAFGAGVLDQRGRRDLSSGDLPASGGARDSVPSSNGELHDSRGPITWHGPIQVAVGEAFVGPWRMNDSDWRYVDDPTVALDRDGTIGVAWSDQSTKDIFFQLYQPDGRRVGRPINVSRSPRIFSWLPRMAILSGEPRHIYLLWQEIVFSGGSHGGEIFFAGSTDGGRSFGAPINLSNTRAGDGKGRLDRDHWDNGSLDLALGPGGELYAAWTEYQGALWFSQSTNGGASFSRPIRVWGATEDAPARGPSLAAGTGGRVALAWTVGEDREADIRLAMSDDEGRTFDRPRILFETKGHADSPSIAWDRHEILHLAFAESPTGPGARYHILYARSKDGGRSFETARNISALDPLASASFPAMSVDGRGQVYVIWELSSLRDLWRGIGFTRSRDGGHTFAMPAVMPGSGDPELGSNGGQQGLLMRKLAVNERGTLAVVNSTFRAGRESRILLYRGK